MSKTTKQILIEARERISKEENWTKGTMARDTNGYEVGARDPKATCWCSLGAIRAATNEGWADAAYRGFEAVVGNLTIVEFNDFSTHEQVLAAFDKAIAACPE